jgi:hypothetical protein
MKRKQKLYPFLLSVIMVLSIFTFSLPSSVKASAGNVKVYILQLSGIGGWVYGGSYNISKVKEGAICALQPSMVDHRPNEILWVHPMYGTSIPFYSINYEVVTSWSQYKNIIMDEKEAIVINTHGEAIPIPSPYDEDWIDGIAWAMYTHRLTWVHTTGYPFYVAVYENGSSTTLGADGFKRLMSHINRGDAECFNPIPPGSNAGLTGAAEEQLHIGYKRMPTSMDNGNPLNGSYFDDYMALSLYEDGYNGISYCSAAVIVFANPGKRFDPTSFTDNPYGFGVYVHVGTLNTYNGSGNSDFDRGYIGAAGAIWAEMNAFSPTSKKMGTFSGNPYCEYALFTRPSISSIGKSSTSEWEVRLSFPVYGVLKHYKYAHQNYVDYVEMKADRIPEDCSIEMKTYLSKQGASSSSGFPLYGISTGASNPPIVQTIMYAIALGTLFFDTLAPIAFLLAPLNGIMLSQNWRASLNPTGYPGVNDPGPLVDFMYTPIENTTDCVEDMMFYTYHEFESIITLVLHVPKNDERDWRIIPLHWTLIMALANGGEAICISGGLSVAVFSDNGNNPTVFFEDFQDGMDGWSAWDDNPTAGYDYWGLYNYSGEDSDSVWCAWNGINSITNQPNWEYGPFYDKYMTAQLIRNIDIKPYQNGYLYFSMQNYVNSNAHLEISYLSKTYTWVNYNESFSSTNGWVIEGPYYLPNNASAIRFTFISGGASSEQELSWGCWLDNIMIKGILSNDANTMGDAGHSFSNASMVSVPALSLKDYAGYLRKEDWYKFPIGSNDRYKFITVNLYYSQNLNFKAELYDPNNQRKQGPLNGISYPIGSSDPLGNWRIRIFPISGFGQYNFSIGIMSPGGGCPYVYIWNGMQFVIDNNILPSSESSGKTDVDDYYKLEQSLVPFQKGTLFSLYSLQLSEFENEHSYIDQTKFIAVDHTSDVKIAVTPNGEILTYKNPCAPVSCFDNYGNNMLEAVNAIDNNYYHGYAGDYLILDFGNVSIQDGAKLVMRADEKELYSINVQVLNSTQEWATVTTVHPRALWATEIVDLSSYLPDANGNLKARLYFTARHKIDYIGLDTTQQATVQIRQGQLLLAIHSNEGFVTQKLLFNDAVYTELLPNQQITPIFILQNSQSAERSYIFYTNGYYYTITQDNP